MYGWCAVCGCGCGIDAVFDEAAVCVCDNDGCATGVDGCVDDADGDVCVACWSVVIECYVDIDCGDVGAVCAGGCCVVLLVHT